MSNLSYEKILETYQRFVENTVRNYQKEYEIYVTEGGKESFQKRYWWAMMNESVDKAEKIMKHTRVQQMDKMKLIDSLQKIAEEALLSSQTTLSF